MTLTWSMCAKLAAHTPAEETFETPSKTLKHVTTPMATKTLSPRMLSNPPSSQSYICHVCRTESIVDSNSSRYISLSKFNDFSTQVDLKFRELQSHIELINDKINTIEQTIFNYRTNISELELAISELSNKLKNVTSKSISSSSSSNANSNNQSSSKSSHVSFPHIKSISTPPPRPMVAKAPDNNRAHPPPVRPPPPHKCSLLVIGDSSTKYAKLQNISYHRTPTYLIEDIDPHQCIGYAKVWLHVGINNLKSIRCSGPHDIRKYFELFIHKVHEIKILSPRTTIIILPILPTTVSVLNDRVRAFNRVLFSTQRCWVELNFSPFASKNDMLKSYYRCYGNPDDKIHLGFNGIRELECLITQKVSLVDARSYRAVVQPNII